MAGEPCQLADYLLSYPRFAAVRVFKKSICFCFPPALKEQQPMRSRAQEGSTNREQAPLTHHRQTGPRFPRRQLAAPACGLHLRRVRGPPAGGLRQAGGRKTHQRSRRSLPVVDPSSVPVLVGIQGGRESWKNGIRDRKRMHALALVTRAWSLSWDRARCDQRVSALYKPSPPLTATKNLVEPTNVPTAVATVNIW